MYCMQQVLVRMRGTQNVNAEWADIQAAAQEARVHDVAFWQSLGQHCYSPAAVVVAHCLIEWLALR